jgi:pseudouridine-5'-phosphate glycosidase
MMCRCHLFQHCLALSCCCCPPQVLDIPRTLEYLETQGVCVAAYGADEFPAFFSRHSGCKAPCRVDTPEQ